MALILIYHRIAEVSADPRGTAVSPDRFARQMEYLRRTCHVLPLLDLAERVGRGAIAHRAVAITFDDGYLNNLTLARPLLEAERLPATVFVVAGDVGRRQGFWWDRLEQALLEPARLPSRLRLRIGDREHEWAMSSGEQMQAAHDELRGLLRTLDAGEREQVLEALRRWSGTDLQEPGDCRPMDEDELRRLSAGGLISLGAHTMTHRPLAALPAEQQRAEVVESKQTLQAIVDGPVHAFAYPYGRATDLDESAVRMAEAAGFCLACTAMQGVVKARDDPFRLQRCEIQNWDIQAFRRHLEWLFASQ